jgi:four helix bundle protein
MALYYNLPLYKDSYDFILKVFKITKKFDREYKYSLGQDMKKEAISLVRNIYRANKTYNKTEYLQQILDDLEVLKLEFRLCKDLQLISL